MTPEIERKLRKELSEANPGDWIADNYFRLHLRHIPDWDRRSKLMDEYGRAMGFDNLARPDELGLSFKMVRQPSLMQHGYGSYQQQAGWLEALEAGNMTLAQRQAYILERLHYTMPNIQVEGLLDPGEPSGVKHDDVKRIRSVITSEFKQSTAHQLANRAEYAKKKAIVFDIETASLKPEDRMWQFSYQLGTDDIKTFQFDNPFMDMGDWDGAKSWTAYKGYKPDEFMDAMGQFLRAANEAELLVGQNVSFDIEHIVRSLEQVKSKMSPEMAANYEEFLKKARSSGVVDTGVLAQQIIGHIDVAPELIKRDVYTRYSMSNILAETDFLERLSDDIGAEAVQAALGGEGGLHGAKVDVFFTDHLKRMLLSGVKISAKHVEGDALRASIFRGAVESPFVRVGDGSLSPFERMVRNQRNLTSGLVDVGDETLAYRAGQLGKSVDEMLAKDGRLKVEYGRLNQMAGRFDEIGLPFQGLSVPERMINSLLGRISPGTNLAREMFGDVIGGGLFEASYSSKIYGSRNLKLPIEVILEAERRGFIQTNLESALKGEGFQQARISVVSHHDGGKGLALVLDDAFGPTGTPEQMQIAMKTAGLGDSPGLRGFLMKVVNDPDLQKHLGLTPDQARKLAEDAGSINHQTLRYGIQIGYVGDSPETRRLAGFLGQLHMDVEKTGQPALVTNITGMVDGNISTGPAVVDTGLDDEGVQAWRLRQGQHSVRVSEQAVKWSEDRVLLWAKNRAEGLGWDVGTTMQRVKNVTRHINRRNMTIGGAIAGGYLLYNYNQKQDPYDETMEFQGYEEGVRSYPLATAGLMQELDQNKIGHHDMGNDRYSHLF